jgi:hypothetical protein
MYMQRVEAQKKLEAVSHSGIMALYIGMPPVETLVTCLVEDIVISYDRKD